VVQIRVNEIHWFGSLLPFRPFDNTWCGR
jgi:hypothetical protein